MPKGAKQQKWAFKRILKDGCRDSLVLWGEILVDGHNRYSICKKYDIPFKTVQMKYLEISAKKGKEKRICIYHKVRALKVRRILRTLIKEKPVKNLPKVQNIKNRLCRNLLNRFLLQQQGNTVSQISAKRRTPIETRNR